MIAEIGAKLYSFKAALGVGAVEVLRVEEVGGWIGLALGLFVRHASAEDLTAKSVFFSIDSVFPVCPMVGTCSRASSSKKTSQKNDSLDFESVVSI